MAKNTVQLPEPDVLSVEQVSSRWGVEVDCVGHLLMTRRLPQAYMLFGQAQVLFGEYTCDGHPRSCAADITFRTGILVRTDYAPPDLFVWPLSQIVRIYEFSGPYAVGRLSLQQFLDYDRAAKLAWTVAFQASTTTILGHNPTYVALDDVRLFESEHGINHLDDTHATPLTTRDTRKQRCRVVAEILWHRDPEATLPDVMRHEWIGTFACGGQLPTEKTFREWVKDLNPNRNPGRRPR